MKKEVLVINRGSDTDNLGDIAINFTLIKLLEERGCKVQSENYIKLFSNIKIIPYTILINLLKMVKLIRKKFDIIIIGGGQLILSNKKFPLSFLTWIILIKIFSNSKIFIYGVGSTHSFNTINKLFYKLGFYFIEEIYVRDTSSEKNIRENFNRRSIVIPDVATVISSVYNPMNGHEYQDLTLFGITHYKSIARYGYMVDNEKKYLKSQAELILKYLRKESVILFANTEADYLYALKFKQYLIDVHNVNINVYKPKSLRDYLNLIKCSKMIISSRMHALIIANSFGVLTVPVIRNLKLESFVNEYLSSWSIDVFYKKLDSSLNKILSI